MSLRVLIANLYIANGTGGEAVAELLADGLRRAGHQPLLYAPTLGPQAIRMRTRGHVVVDRIAELPFRPDVLHLQQMTPAAMALAAFPDVPAVYASHAAALEVDAPIPHPQIRRWVAVDDLCRDRCLSRGVPAERLSVVLNGVDMLRFQPRPPLPARPARALLLTKTSGQRALVRASCDALGIQLDELGPGTGRVTDRLEEALPRYDIVFATARMALEAACVGCAVVVGDDRGFAGLLTSARLEAWRRLNFGAGLLTQPMTAAGLRDAIAGYDAADAAAVAARLRDEATAEAYAAAFVEVYRQALTDPPSSDTPPAAAMATWLEALLPTAEDRPWRQAAREIGDFHARPVTEGIDALRRDLADALGAQLPAMTEAAVAEASSRLLPQMPGIRMEQALRRLWRRALPSAVRRPLHRLRRALLRDGAD